MAKTKGTIAKARPGTNPAAALPGATAGVVSAAPVAEAVVSVAAVSVAAVAVLEAVVLISVAALSYCFTTKSATSLPYLEKYPAWVSVLSPPSQYTSPVSQVIERFDDRTLDAFGNVLGDLSNDSGSLVLARASRGNHVQSIGAFHIRCALLSERTDSKDGG
ncbi:hypothetical protein HG530_001069 [Fusarium avenaceum]|nr:hypothetical protein HG530_001069 [Fusarium avenaceum]